MNASDPEDPPDPSPAPNDEYIGQTILPCAFISIFFATLFVGLRFYTRGVILKRFHREDWFILVALAFAYATSGTVVTMFENGLGRHRDWVKLQHSLDSFYKANLFENLLYTLTLIFVKISILCLYIRVLTYDYIRLAAKILLGIVLVSHTWIIAAILTTCVPLSAFWDSTVDGGNFYCHSGGVFWSNFGLHVGTDFLIFLLPLPVIFRLRVVRRQKIGLYVVFLLAFAVCATSIVRMTTFTIANNDENNNITYTGVIITNWTMIELSASIVCACLTTIRPLIDRLFPAFAEDRQPGLDTASTSWRNATSNRAILHGDDGGGGGNLSEGDTAFSLVMLSRVSRGSATQTQRDRHSRPLADGAKPSREAGLVNENPQDHNHRRDNSDPELALAAHYEMASTIRTSLSSSYTDVPAKSFRHCCGDDDDEYTLFPIPTTSSAATVTAPIVITSPAPAVLGEVRGGGLGWREGERPRSAHVHS